MQFRAIAFVCCAPLALLASCAKAPPEKVSLHQDVPPHGGTPVAVGGGQYHLELVLEPAAGRLQAYLLDDEMEDFVRSSAGHLTIAASAGGSATTLDLAAVANPMTGETASDTSLFAGQSDWLRAHPAFEGVLGPVTIRGTPCPAAAFHFPAAAKAGP